MGDMRTPSKQQPGSPVKQQFDSPVHQQPGSPVKQQFDSPVKQQFDSPVHQQFDSPVHQQPWSPVKQQTRSPSFEKQDEQTPFSPTSSIEAAPSPASTDHDSPSGKKAARPDRITQERNQEEKKNESLQKEQINLMKQKNDAKDKVKLLKEMFHFMKHCRCCLDDTHQKLIQEGDYSFNISLDENTLQSSNSQNGLAKESLEDAVCCITGDPVMDLPAPSNSMTNPDICGDFTSELLGLEFIQQIRRSSENPDESMTTYDVTERHEWLDQPDWTGSILDTQNTNPSYSRKIREVNKIAADLEADVSACFPKKRRNSLEDANEHCIKNTKQDHRIAISAPLREKNGQENVSVTEQMPIRCIPTTNSRRRRQVIRKEVCIKQNEEKTAVHSTVETSDNETAVKIVVESLSEKFTSAVNLTNTEDRNFAAIVPVKDVKYSAQSAHGVMPEIKESGHAETPGIKETKESMTETDSVARTENDTNVNLLEKPMKTLSICDTDRTKEGAVNTANKPAEEVDLIKDAKEPFTTAKNESYDTNGGALIKENNENLHMNNEQEDQIHKVHKLNNNNSSLRDSSTKKHLPADRPNKIGDAETEAKKKGKFSYVINVVSKLRSKINTWNMGHRNTNDD